MENTRTMRVNKWGNSLGIRFPSEFVDLVGIQEKSLVEIKIEGEKLILTKSPVKYPAIEELFAGFDGEYEAVEIDWGAPVGEEVW
jgi:antitoxin MazE